MLSPDNPKKANAHRDRAQLLFTFYAVARGGETKFLRWDQFSWDSYFQNLEGLWKRIKTMFHHTISFQCCYLGFLCCLYHSLGCFFAVEDGLFRHTPTGTVAEKTRIRNRYIFPHLWKISDPKVATMLTTLIREHSDAPFKKLNQSRSLRVGANTELAVHPDISPEQQRIAGGFAAGNNSELYTRMNPDLCLPAANALAQWPRATGKESQPPSLDCLISTMHVTLEQLECLTNHLYIICIDQFQRKQTLRPFLHACTASLIMYYPEMQKECGMSNEVGLKLAKSLQQAKLASSSVEANKLLNEWSQVIKEDYDQKNSLIQHCTDTTILQVVQAQSVMINNLISLCGEQKKNIIALKNTVESLQVSILEQPKIIATTMAKAFLESQKKFIAMSPASNNSEVAATEKPLGDKDDDTHKASSESNYTANLLKLALANNNEAIRDDTDLPEEFPFITQEWQKNLEDAEKDQVGEALRWTDLATESTTNRELYIRSVLEKMVEDNECVLPQGGSLANTLMPSLIDRKNAGRFKNAMLLVTSVLTDNQKKMLALTKRQRRQVPNFAGILKVELYSIEKNASEKMRELDGQSRTTTFTIIGLGNHYGKYLKKLEEAPHEVGQKAIKDFFPKM
jgi:hypothetical protein